MQKFVFKVVISHELLHKDGKAEGDLYCFDLLASATLACAVVFFVPGLTCLCCLCLCLFPAAGIGVPIMLAYVYGVVPISLCRSGGCGVSAGNGKGVRIEFDDENDMNVGSGAAATGKFPSLTRLSTRMNEIYSSTDYS